MDSIWKSKVSSDDNFLLDFNLPWRFTIFIQPREKPKSLKSIKRGMLPKKMQTETYNPSTRGWCLSPAGLHEWRLSVGYLQHKYSQIKSYRTTKFTMYSFLNKENCGLLHFKWMDMSCRAHTVVALDHCVLKQCGQWAQQSWLLSLLPLMKVLFSKESHLVNQFWPISDFKLRRSGLCFEHHQMQAPSSSNQCILNKRIGELNYFF